MIVLCVVRVLSVTMHDGTDSIFSFRIVTALPSTYASSLSLLACAKLRHRLELRYCNVSRFSTRIVCVAGRTRVRGYNYKNEFYVRCVPPVFPYFNNK